GLRPGEKLFEELVLCDRVVGTRHPKILQAQEEWLSEGVLRPSLKKLKRACDDGDETTIRVVLASLVSGFDAAVAPVDKAEEAGWAKPGGDNVYPLFGND